MKILSDEIIRLRYYKVKKLKDYEILVVCDSDKNKADRAAKIFKCQKIYNYFSMLKKFENKFTKKYKSKFGVAVRSGTDALMISPIDLNLTFSFESFIL